MPYRIFPNKSLCVAQQDNREPGEKAQIAQLHLADVQHLVHELEDSQVWNMDEVPCFIDMTSDRTVTFKGERGVDAVGTGHGKSRFITVLTVAKSGMLLKTMIILKGLKNVPKINVPANVSLTVSVGGSMNERLMLHWVEKVFRARGPFALTKASVLLDG